MAKRIIVIGGGTGGYVAAIRAAQLGAQVTLIEKDKLGGTCVNRGCIPTKALLQTAHLLKQINEAGTFGINAGKASVDFVKMHQRKQAVVDRLRNGVTGLLRKNKVQVIADTAVLVDPKTVKTVGKKETISADSLVIASGSEPAKIPIEGIDHPSVITSDEALTMETSPRSMVVIGGGVVGLEFAQIMSRLGSKVTIIEMMPQILPTEDTEVVNALTEALKGEGIEILTNTSVTKIGPAQKKGEATVSFKAKDGSARDVTAEKVLVAVGRKPYTTDLGIEKLGLAVVKGCLKVNERMETNVPGVYAVGDVIGGFMLAHVSMEEGKCAVENILGANQAMAYNAVPRCVYTSPEMAGAGMTEAQAKEKYGDIKVGRFPFIGNGKAVIVNEAVGMVKVVADAKYGQILGVHILGPHATDLIAEATLGVNMEATIEDVGGTIHAHPTLAEAVAEAVLGVNKSAIHI